MERPQGGADVRAGTHQHPDETERGEPGLLPDPQRELLASGARRAATQHAPDERISDQVVRVRKPGRLDTGLREGRGGIDSEVIEEPRDRLDDADSRPTRRRSGAGVETPAIFRSVHVGPRGSVAWWNVTNSQAHRE